MTSSTNMSLEQARAAVTAAMGALKQEQHQQKLKQILAECAAVIDPMQQIQLKIQRLLPVVTEILGQAFKEENVMMALMQVQAHASSDPKLAVDVGKIMRAIGGDLSAVTTEEEFEEVE